MIGRTFPNYRVVSELGAGGMGVVYKALDLRLERHVALKVLPPGKSDDAARRSRFLQEAKAASALNDPHIVTIYDIFTDDKFSSDVVGLAVTGNTVSQDQKVYHLGLDPLSSLLVIDANRIHFTGAVFASYDDGTTSPTLADWRSRTGQDRLTTSY